MKTTFLPLSDPDISEIELEAVREVLLSPRLSAGPVVEEFEAAFAQYLGRKHAIAAASGEIALLLTLQAYGIGQGDEVVASAHSFRETAHAIALTGARPVFADIDYWAGTIAPDKAAARLTERTRAIIASNANGHPAPWDNLRELAKGAGVVLIEDSTEAIGSVYKGSRVGSFGDCAIFDFSQPGALVCGEGGMIATDDDDRAYAIRRLRSRRIDERSSMVIGAVAPLQAGLSDLSAALGLAQLRRIDVLLARRKRVEAWYCDYLRSFEGIKDPYIAPDVDEVHWFLYVVHLGTRFSRSSRDSIIDDLRTERVESAAYSQPLHLQRRYFEMGYRRGDFFVTEKVADRALALPFHAHLTEEQVAFIVGTTKDASINVGAGTAIY
ncbi:DegT/DnrJ/EryC1/StrS family aminotransferase [Methylocella sp.]|uniref:DegT/DnrJ/EryC1/StrS family aminotransferase n=1 Tax=Methylocella sp. TaxID=1978226 RepID=UPI003C28D58F